jgi:phosphoribosylglycinamide formyltransferase-1
MRLGIFASHTGSNFQAILDACLSGQLAAEPAVLISNNSRSIAMQRAKQAQIPTYHLSSTTHTDESALDHAIVEALDRHNVELVTLAGYMKRLGPETLAAYRGRILNIHPSLLPRFGGQGMYGSRVHEAVIAANEKESGVTIHLVDGEYDTGPVVAQARIPVKPGDTAESLAKRILKREHSFYVETLHNIIVGQLTLPELEIKP